MADIKLTIKGAKELRDRLKQYSGDLPDGVDAVLEINAGAIADKAKVNAPTRQSPRSDRSGRTVERAGTLRQSINVENPEPLVWAVAVNARYAPYIEFGTRFASPGPPSSIPDELREVAAFYKADPLKRPNNIRARPFLWPAYLEQLPTLINDLNNELNSI